MIETLPERGVVYSVTGDRFRREAEISANRLKRQMPDRPIALFTDKADNISNVFDIIRINECPSHTVFDKQFGFREILFEQRLHIDSDTYITMPVPEIFDLLDRMDMAATNLINVWAEPVILHGHSTRLEDLAKQLNPAHGHRPLIPNLGGFGKLRIFSPRNWPQSFSASPLRMISSLIKGICRPFRWSE